MAEHKKLYLGAQNDAVFIIDTPPRPAPMDYLTEGNPDTNVIAKIYECGPDAGKRLVAAHNAFHSPDRHIPTEQISERLFWELYNLHNANLSTMIEQRERMKRYGKTTNELQSAIDQTARLLDSLKVEQE